MNSARLRCHGLTRTCAWLHHRPQHLRCPKWSLRASAICRVSAPALGALGVMVHQAVDLAQADDLTQKTCRPHGPVRQSARKWCSQVEFKLMSFSTNISPYGIRVVERLAHGVVVRVETFEKSLGHTSLPRVSGCQQRLSSVRVQAHTVSMISRNNGAMRAIFSASDNANASARNGVSTEVPTWSSPMVSLWRRSKCTAG